MTEPRKRRKGEVPFDVVPEGKARSIREGYRGGTPPSPISLALEAGEMVYIQGAAAFASMRSSTQQPHGYLGARGFQVRSRSNGNGGYLWAERKDES